MINIYNNYYISADDNSFMLKRKIVNKKKDTGEEYDSFKTLGYFTSLHGVYSYFVREVEKDILSSEDVTTLHDFIGQMDEVISDLTYTIRQFESLEFAKKRAKEE